MKKTTTVLVCLSAWVSLASPALAEKWHTVMSAEGTRVDIELDSLINLLVYKEAWVRVKLSVNGRNLKNGSGEIVDEIKFHRRFDCVRKRMLNDSLVQSGPNGVHHAFDVPKEKQTWSPVDPSDEFDNAVFSYVCG